MQTKYSFAAIWHVCDRIFLFLLFQFCFFFYISSYFFFSYLHLYSITLLCNRIDTLTPFGQFDIVCLYELERERMNNKKNNNEIKYKKNTQFGCSFSSNRQYSVLFWPNGIIYRVEASIKYEKNKQIIE